MTEDTGTLPFGLDAIEQVRERAERRHVLTIRAVVLAALAAVLAVGAEGWVAVPLVAVAVLCAATVAAHELREVARRRAVAGSMGRDWH